MATKRRRPPPAARPLRRPRPQPLASQPLAPKPLAPKPLAPLPPEAPALGPPLLDLGRRSVGQLAHDILTLLARSDQRAVGTRAEVGGLLAEVRSRLPHGAWIGWLRAHVPFNPRTAERAIRLHELAGADSQLIARLAPLGVGEVSVEAHRDVADEHPAQ